MSLLDRFLKYVKVDTMSDDKNADCTPSTKKQFDLANILKDELIGLGLKDVMINEYCTVYATLPANQKGYDKIGFLAHMDTIPELSGSNVKPNVVVFDGTPIRLGNTNKYLSQDEFSSLKKQIGHTLITTDGTTVLGCDDKGGVAIIMQMLEDIITKNLPHGEIHVAFTPDEEIGTGVLKFDTSKFPVDYAYTVDGGDPCEFSYETFNAAQATVNIKGFEIHPGFAKDKMINASLVAMEFNSLLNPNERPEYTQGYDGFNHLTEITGSIGSASMHYIIRNHSLDLLEKQKQEFYNAALFLNKKYPNSVSVEIKDQYKNMRVLIEKDMRCVDKALNAYKSAGVDVFCAATRGGTDGSQLTFMGINTPNLGTGGYNEHGVFEYADLNEMTKMLEVATLIATTK
ncbi:MAG: peptidase T [Acholeplasmatales bacterium]|nr:peptidase T [Acholeplasmatales bacterium]